VVFYFHDGTLSDQLWAGLSSPVVEEVPNFADFMDAVAITQPVSGYPLYLVSFGEDWHFSTLEPLEEDDRYYPACPEGQLPVTIPQNSHRLRPQIGRAQRKTAEGCQVVGCKGNSPYLCVIMRIDHMPKIMYIR
jgi:hypothetical protein